MRKPGMPAHASPFAANLRRFALAGSPPDPTARTTRNRSPELGKPVQTKTTVSRCELRIGRGKPAQSPTIPQNGATLNQRIPGPADAGWRSCYPGHMLDNRVNRRRPSVKRFRGVWSGFFGAIPQSISVAGTDAGPAGAGTAAADDDGNCLVGTMRPVTPSCSALATRALYSSSLMNCSRVRM